MLSRELTKLLALNPPKQRNVHSSPTKPFSASSRPAQCAGLFFKRGLDSRLGRKKQTLDQEEVENAMEMVLLTVLCILTVAFIERQNASMRRLQRIRLDKDDRGDR